MKRQEIIDRIHRLLVEEFEADPAKIRPETDMYRELDLDSLDGINLITILEKELKVRVDPQKLRNVRTLSQLHDFVIEMAKSAGKLED